MGDHTIAVIANRIPEPEVDPESQNAIEVPPTDTFVRHAVPLHATVKEGGVIAYVRKNGVLTPVKATKDGVVSYQAPLKPGMSMGRYAMDNTLAVVDKPEVKPLDVEEGLDERPTPLQNEDGTPIKKPVTFEKWEVEPGDMVSKGDTIAIVKDGDGNEVPVVAQADGVVVAKQRFNKGDKLDDLFEGDDTNLATVRPLFAPLPVNESGTTEEKTKSVPIVRSRDDMVFDEWLVDVGDEVEPGSPIAKVLYQKDPNCNKDLEECEMIPGTIKAPDGGRYVQALMPFEKGQLMKDKMVEGDTTIAVLGNKRPPIKLIDEGDHLLLLSSDPLAADLAGMTFCAWNVEKGGTLEAGQSFAEVSRGECEGLDPDDIHPPDRRLDAVSNIPLVSPFKGCIKEMADLHIGHKVGECILGMPPKIINVGTCAAGPPWWLWLLLALLCLLCCLLLLLLLCCRK